jgi:hypothetical protein
MTARSSEIVAANGVTECGPNLRHGPWPFFAHSETMTARLDDRAQDRERQTFVIGLGHLVELGGNSEPFRK